MILDRLFRKESRILTSADLARYLSHGFDSASGISVTQDRALRYAAVFACVRVLSESVGQLPVHLYEQRERAKFKATKHPVYRLLHDAPNQYQTAQEWKEFNVACLGLWGNSYNFINWVREEPTEILPWHPANVTPQMDRRTRELTYEVDESGVKKRYAAKDVLHIKLFPLDGVRGASPIEYARESIGLGIAAEAHGAGLFSRGASPGGVLQSPKPLNDKAYARLRESWEARHSGAANSHRVAVLEDGVTWQSIGMPSKDAQWLEGRKYQRSEIAGIYRVPPHLIGDLERATFSNIEHQSLDFVVHSLMPYLTRIEQRANMQLLKEDERGRYFTKFQVAGLLRGDMQARSQFYTQMVQNGAMSPNDIRELEDQNPREGGDVYLQPANMIVSGAKPPADEPAAPTATAE